MRLWDFELERGAASLIRLLAEFQNEPAPTRSPQKRALPYSVAIVLDQSRWGRPVRLETMSNPNDLRWVLIVDASAPEPQWSAAAEQELFTHAEACGRGDIGPLAKVLAEHLGPEFSFALFDVPRQHLWLVRDSIGSRPLYWRRERNTVHFSSSRKDLALAGSRPAINESTVAVLLGSTFDVWSKEELLHGLHRVPHGGFALISLSQNTTGQWWAPTFGAPRQRKADRTAITHAVRALLEDAVAARLGAANHVGAHVSGGIDSTGVAALSARRLAREGRRMIGAYAWAPAVSDAYPDMGALDERRRIEAFTAKENTPVRFGGASAEDFVAFLDRPIEFEGTADLADEMPILQMAQADGVEIMMSGWGGDEVFSSHGFGYLSYLLSTAQWGRAERWLRARFRTLRKIGPVASVLWWQGIHPMLPDFLHHLFDPFDHGGPAQSLIAPDLLKKHRDQIRAVSRTFRSTNHPNQSMYQHFMAGHITHRMETWDVWSRQHGFHYTYPLTDRRLIEHLLSLSPEAHFPDEQARGLAKDVLGDTLPSGVNKFDAANEAHRKAVRDGAWRILASLAKRGDFKAECPWIDMGRFRARLATPVDQNTPEGVIAFLHLFNAVRAWRMWARQEGLHQGDAPLPR